MWHTMNLRKLNSATKYPSIQTYHALGRKGRLTEEVQVGFASETVHVSEKVDGTNTRIIVAPDGRFIVGSRNDLLWHSTDLLFNPAQSIVEVLRPRVDGWLARGTMVPREGALRVFYGESYGGRITGASKNYSRAGATDFRLFDVMELPEDALRTVLSWNVEEIAAWREGGGQPFWDSRSLESLGLPLTPQLAIDGGVPMGHQAVLDWMTALLPQSLCTLDDTGLGGPEGLIVRNRDRSRIAKIRFQDYRRTLNIRHP